MWKGLTTKFLEIQKHELGLSGHFKMLRNEMILNVHVRQSIAEVEKCWTCRPHEVYDTRTHMLVLWRGVDNLDTEKIVGK